MTQSLILHVTLQMRVPFSSSDVRLAVIQFGSLNRTDLTFDVSIVGDYDSLVKQIEAIERLEGLETNTAMALREAKSYFDNYGR